VVRLASATSCSRVHLSRGDRGFESTFLQRGVCEPSVPLGFRDCRGGSIRRAARPAYLDSADLRVDPISKKRVPRPWHLAHLAQPATRS